MIDELALFLLIAVVLVPVLVILKLASFFEKFQKDTKSICRKMDHAGTYNEYRYWRRELRCHYLMLIPFVTKKNVRHVYDSFFHRKHEEKMEERRDSLAPLLMPSVLGICICLVCVCGMTWAWYTASIQAPAQKMTAAYYEVVVENVVEAESLEENVNKKEDGTYPLEAKVSYKVTLRAEGSVKKCGGYCLIENQADEKYYTQTFAPENDAIEILLIPEEDGDYTFTGVWGSLPSEITEKDILKDQTGKTQGSEVLPEGSGEPDGEQKTDASTNDVTQQPVSQQTPSSEEPKMDDTYTVQSGDTLSGIAAKYSIPSDKLAAYNSLDDVNSIKEGQILKIPPQE